MRHQLRVSGTVSAERQRAVNHQLRVSGCRIISLEAAWALNQPGMNHHYWSVLCSNSEEVLFLQFVFPLTAG
jgi:hypothetical protein